MALLAVILVMPTLIMSEHNQVPVQLINLTQEDVWLQPRARLGVWSPMQCMSDDGACEVRFQRISANTEQVSVDMKEPQQASNQAALFHHLGVQWKSKPS